MSGVFTSGFQPQTVRKNQPIPGINQFHEVNQDTEMRFEIIVGNVGSEGASVISAGRTLPFARTRWTGHCARSKRRRKVKLK